MKEQTMPMIKLTNDTDVPQTVTEDSERKALVTIAPGETVDVLVAEADLVRLRASGVLKISGDPAPKPAPSTSPAKPAAKADDDDDEPKRRR